MRTVVVESALQFATDRHADNMVYLDRCLRDCALREEAPFASHKLLPGALDDTIPAERELGMRAGWAIGRRLDGWIFYIDRGFTPGMVNGLKFVLGLREDLPSKRARISFRGFYPPWEAAPFPSATLSYSHVCKHFEVVAEAFALCCPGLL
jgi:hypothetical protein